MGYAIIGFGTIDLARGKIKATNKTWEDDFAPSHAARSSNAQQ
jgi:hypothetical protein